MRGGGTGPVKPQQPAVRPGANSRQIRRRIARQVVFFFYEEDFLFYKKSIREQVKLWEF